MQKTLENEPQEPLRSEIIAMALSDGVPFRAIEQRFGINEPALKRLMRSWIRPARYRAWRKRVAKFRAQRGQYKS
jgi:uncharacterized protein (TIGR03643 family)